MSAAEPDGGGSAHGSDVNWTVKTSIGVLAAMICLFGLVSEVCYSTPPCYTSVLLRRNTVAVLSGVSDWWCGKVLVECLKPALIQMGIPEGFAGLTLIAIIPNTTSFVNAVRGCHY